MSTISPQKPSALGQLLRSTEEWRKRKIRSRLMKQGVTEGVWRGLTTNKNAAKVPAFIRDIIVEEIPESKDLFLPQVRK